MAQKSALVYAVVLVAALAPYMNAMTGDLVFDDTVAVLHNQDVVVRAPGRCGTIGASISVLI